MFDSLVTLNSLDCTRGVLGLVFSVRHCWFCITKLSDWLKKKSHAIIIIIIIILIIIIIIVIIIIFYELIVRSLT